MSNTVDLPADPLGGMTLAELGLRLRQGAVTIAAVTEAYLARIERIDPRLGAYEFVATEAAMKQASALDQLLAAGTDLGSLMGIPIAVKDVFAVEGMPTNAGSRLDVAELVGREGTFVKRLKQSGCVILGKTKTVEFAYGAAGINTVRGTPWNPWDPIIHRVPGGSSSGSAVAVAAGLCAFATGTDTGGSVRLPASFCGVFGLKTTAGLWPGDGMLPLAPGLDSIGLLTRSAADAALAFAALADRRLPEAAPLRGRRLGRLTGYFEERLDASVSGSYERTVDLLRENGADVDDIEMPEARERETIFPNLLPVELLATLRQERFAAGRDRMDPVVAARIERGSSTAAIDYVRCFRRHEDLKRIAAERMKGFDAWIMPTTSRVAMPIGEFTDVKTSAELAFEIARNSQPANLFGQCATSSPIQARGEALPVGLQIVCNSFDEGALITLALALEELTGMPPNPTSHGSPKRHSSDTIERQVCAGASIESAIDSLPLICTLAEETLPFVRGQGGRRHSMRKCKPWCIAAAAVITVISLRLDASAWAEDWDAAKAKAQCANFTTYGMAEEGVYGPWFKAMYGHYGWTNCQRTDNDLSSSEVVAAYEAEKNNPKGVIADIGIIFGPEAAKRGLVLKYTPKGSDFVPVEYKQEGGGWIGSVVGAVGFTVNLEAIPNPPRSWADLLKPEYKGKIKGINPTSGGTGFMALLAANYALGGDPKDPAKAYDFFKRLRASGNLYDGDCDIPNLERGECGMKIQYDFYGLAEGVAAMKAKGVKAEFIVPSDGSIWAPSALLPNAFTDKPDLAKAILDWAMTDEAAVAWAKTYAHPMKQVFGGLKLPAEATAQWLPESAYAHVGKLEAFPALGQVAEDWESKVLQ